MEKIRNLVIRGSSNKPILFDIHFEAAAAKRPIILYVHGFNGFKDWGNFDLIADYFAMHGFCFVKMNLSHNGTSPNSPHDFTDLEAYSLNNYSKELFDVGQMIQWICSEANEFATVLDADKIILLGHSRGGGISILKAAEDRRVKALITWATVQACKTPWGNWDHAKMQLWKNQGVMYIENKRTKQQMPLQYQLYEDYQQNHQKLDIQTAIQQLKIPTQLCHGTFDEAVPYSAFLQLQQWRPDADFVSVKSNHVFDRTHPYSENFIPTQCLDVINQNISFLRRHGF